MHSGSIKKLVANWFWRFLWVFQKSADPVSTGRTRTLAKNQWGFDTYFGIFLASACSNSHYQLKTKHTENWGNVGEGLASFSIDKGHPRQDQLPLASFLFVYHYLGVSYGKWPPNHPNLSQIRPGQNILVLNPVVFGIPHFKTRPTRPTLFSYENQIPGPQRLQTDTGCCPIPLGIRCEFGPTVLASNTWRMVSSGVRGQRDHQRYPLVNWHSCGKPPFLIGKSTISIGNFQ